MNTANRLVNAVFALLLAGWVLGGPAYGDERTDKRLDALEKRLENLEKKIETLIKKSTISKKRKELPEDFTEQKKRRLVDTFIEGYNASDGKKIWGILDDLVRYKISPADLQVGLEPAITHYGEIVSGRFSHHEYLGNASGHDGFRLVYDLIWKKPGLTNKKLTFQVGVIEGRSAVLGFNIQDLY